MIDRITPTRRPDRPAAGYQKWRLLSFLHWEVPATVLRPLVPARLALDDFDGRFFVGLVPFTMRGVRPHWAPSVPGISNFHETNVRTYVHLDGEGPGVWFFSLDAANRLAVWLARRFWGLPYFHATMSVASGDTMAYDSTRGDVRCHVKTRATTEPAASEPGTLEHFLAERYLLYAEREGTLSCGQVHHVPYPLQKADVLACDETLLAAAGIAKSGAPLGHYASGVDVEVFALRSV